MGYLVEGYSAANINLVLGSVSSRILIDGEKRKYKTYVKLKEIETNNQLLIKKLRTT